MAESYAPRDPTGVSNAAHTYAPPSARLARRARLIRDLRPGEQLISLQRRHPAVLFSSLMPLLLLFVIWLVGTFFVLPLTSRLEPDPYGPPVEGVQAWLPVLVWIAWVAMAVFLVLWLIYRALDWGDHWLALTTRRLIVMDKTPFLRETRREVPVDRVQNVTAEYPNSMGIALDYGDLRVDTAGIGVIEFRHLPHPRLMREAIFTQQAHLRAAQPSSDDVRKAAVRSLLRGTDPALHEQPTPPEGNAVPVPLHPVLYPGSYFSTLFPFAPQRFGGSVTWHKHWIVLVRGLILPALLWFVSLCAWVSLTVAESAGQFGSLSQVTGWACVGLAPVCLLWALWKWDDWRNDLYRLDNERIYDIERLPLGMREQSKETLITRVTDVMYTVPGPLANMLNYGDVELKTPGEATQFIFRKVPAPRDVQREIMDRIEEYRAKSKAGTDREIEAWLKAYEDVKREGAGP